MACHHNWCLAFISKLSYTTSMGNGMDCAFSCLGNRNRQAHEKLQGKKVNLLFIFLFFYFILAEFVLEDNYLIWHNQRKVDKKNLGALYETFLKESL